jgi:hypothetical protein
MLQCNQIEIHLKKKSIHTKKMNYYSSNLTSTQQDKHTE